MSARRTAAPGEPVDAAVFRAVPAGATFTTLAAGGGHVCALRGNGSVLCWGDNTYGQCDVSGWTNIIEICCGQYHTVGVKNDGTLVATGLNTSGQCDVGAIDLW